MQFLGTFTQRRWRLSFIAAAIVLGSGTRTVWAGDAASSGSAPQPELKTGSETKETRADPASHQTQTPDLGISPNEPVYFSLGFHERVHAKFQISLKYRPFGPTNDQIAGDHFWNDLYAAYTQTSLWDLQSDSKPFYDSSYRPSLFYQRRLDRTVFGGQFSLRGGFEHESNGKSGADSRSINTLFIRPSWWWNIDEKWAIAFSPRLHAYVEDSENPDIGRYRGYVDWNLSLAQDKGVRLSTTFRHGSSGHMSTLIDFSYPFQDITPLRSLGIVHGYFHLQFFDGYGETILSYNRRLPWQLRVGVMLVR